MENERAICQSAHANGEVLRSTVLGIRDAPNIEFSHAGG